MLRQSTTSNDSELQFAALGATVNLLVCALVIVALWELFVLLMQASQLIAVSSLVLAEVR